MTRKQRLFLIVGSLLIAALGTVRAFAAPPSPDGKYSLWDVKRRAAFTLSTGYLGFTRYWTNQTWNGADIGGAITYNLHPLLSVYGLYSHGFPFDSNDGHANFLRLVANLAVYPGPDILPGHTTVYIGAGPMWSGTADVRSWRGVEAHITATYLLHPFWAGYATYSHAFAGDASLNPDYDFYRVGIIRKVFP